MVAGTSRISGAMITLDQILDFIPFFSIVNNAADITAKVALRILAYTIPSAYRSIQNYPIVKHLNQKTVLACVLMAIPFFKILLKILILWADSQPSVSANRAMQEQPDHAFQERVESLRQYGEAAAKELEKTNLEMQKDRAEKRAASEKRIEGYKQEIRNIPLTDDEPLRQAKKRALESTIHAERDFQQTWL